MVIPVRKVDLHAHTYCSDGTLSPTELVLKAKEKELCAIAVTDHDTTAGIPEAARAGSVHGVEVIPGVEISALYPHGTLHILGYFIDIESPSLQSKLQEYVDARNRRNPLILDKLAEQGCPLSMDEVTALAGGKVINRPHIAQAMLNRGYVQNRQEAFDRYLAYGAPAYMPKEVFTPEEAIRMIHDAGGVVVIAHPDQLGHSDIEQTLLELRYFAGLGVDGVEAYHGECREINCAPYVRIAEELGLLVTGGSDFHGDRKHCELGDVKGIPYLPYEIVERLRQAARPPVRNSR